MNIVETDYWCLMLPPEWSAEEEEGSVLITDQDGIGELAVTTLVREPEDAPETTSLGDCSGGVARGQQLGRRHVRRILRRDRRSSPKTGTVLQEWYLGHGVALLYCTYACDVEDAGMDMSAVEEILGTLVPGDALLVD